VLGLQQRFDFSAYRRPDGPDAGRAAVEARQRSFRRFDERLMAAHHVRVWHSADPFEDAQRLV
jgi:hypothetical protein